MKSKRRSVNGNEIFTNLVQICIAFFKVLLSLTALCSEV